TRKPVKAEMHQMSDNTQGNWNGMIGRLELRASDPVWLEDIQVYPEVAARAVRVKVQLGNDTGLAGSGMISLAIKGPGITSATRDSIIVWNTNGGLAEIEVPLGKDAKLWDEFHPELCQLAVELRGNGIGDQRTLNFGLREFLARGSQFA